MLCLENSQFVHGDSAKKVCAFGKQQLQVVCVGYRFRQVEVLHSIVILWIACCNCFNLILTGTCLLQAYALWDKSSLELNGKSH